MKLKDRRHSHFIQAINGGLVVKVPSRDSHGKPTLRFKGITAIYESEDAEKVYSGSRHKKQKGRSTLLPFDQNKVETEMPMGRKAVKIKLKSYEINREGDDIKTNSDAYDDSLGSMTLKEMKERSKSKKRKLSKSIASVKQDLGTCSLGGTSSNKHEVTVQLEEDAELDEPLSCLKLKVSKKLKTERKTVARDTCTSPKSLISGDVSTEQILNYQSSIQNILDVHGPFNPNVETLADNLDSQNVVHVADGSTPGSHMKMSYGGECFDEIPEGVNGSVTRGSLFLCKEISVCVANEVSKEYLEPKESSHLASNTENCGEITKDSCPETHMSLPSVVSEHVENASASHSVLYSIPTEAIPSTNDVSSEKYASVHSSDATKGFKDVETLEDYFCVMTENPPKKLLSTRKAISPTSQEKLCRDLNVGDSCDNAKTFKGTEKLLFEEQTERNNSLVKSGVEGEDVSIPKQNIKKLKKYKNGSSQLVPRGILKVPPVYCSSPSSGIECASVSTCAQKAIEFSQRQMHDIESLAMKLMKELKFIKDIAEETLCSEVCQATSSKYTADQIESAIEDVARVEETTGKWLSIMTKDCTRFCKIMKSTEMKSSLVSGYMVHKKKRNVTFADEDGGILCHVKVYEDPQHLPVVSESRQAWT